MAAYLGLNFKKWTWTGGNVPTLATTSHRVDIRSKEKGKKWGISPSKPENLQILKKLHQIRFIYKWVGVGTMTSSGLGWGQGRRNLSGTSTKERSSGTDMFVLSDQPLPVEGGRELCLTRGLEGGDWNATAECQTLSPDEIIKRFQKGIAP